MILKKYKRILFACWF